jgi:hypothetical protein
MCKSQKQKYLALRNKWLDWLIIDSFHAIRPQVHDLLWDYAVFISINELRKISQTAARKSVGFNRTVLNLFDSGFVATQSMRIRRLTEHQPEAQTKEVISLRGIIKDLKDNIELITRKNYVTIYDRPYNYEKARKIENGLINYGNGIHVDTMKSEGPLAWEVSERSHLKFDKLSCVSITERRANDLIDIDYFNKLQSKLSICDDIIQFSNKFIAHAASQTSRIGLTNRQTKVTLKKLEDIHKSIYQVTNSILNDIFGESMGGLPVPAFPLFENLEKSWATESDIEALEKFWHEYERKVSTW